MKCPHCKKELNKIDWWFIGVTIFCIYVAVFDTYRIFHTDMLVKKAIGDCNAHYIKQLQDNHIINTINFTENSTNLTGLKFSIH